MRFSSTLLPLALAVRVSAHGYLNQFSVEGTVYKGTGDGGSPDNTAVRPTKPYDVGPVKGADNPDMSCGLSPVQNARLQANVNPGDKVSVLWTGENGGNWIHATGPILTYMAQCTGVKDCTTFDSSEAKWFKVDEKGVQDDGKTWWVDEFHTNNQPVPFTIPDNLKAGNYLVRSELIALHNAASVGGAEFYPNCFQVAVGGTGTGTPSSTVSFPGAYSDTDPGIKIDVYDGNMADYVFPGPPVVDLGGSGSGSGSDDTTSAAPAPAASSTSKPKVSSTQVVPSASAPSEPPAPVVSASVGISASAPASTGKCAKKNSERRRRSVSQSRQARHARRNAMHHGSSA